MGRGLWPLPPALWRGAYDCIPRAGGDGLAGDAIPLAARIIAVCAAYDAMTTDGPDLPAVPPAGRRTSSPAARVKASPAELRILDVEIEVP